MVSSRRAALLAVAGVVAAALAGGLVPTSATAAASYPPACPSGQLCVRVVVDNQNASVPAGTNTLYLSLFGAGQPATLVTPTGTSFAIGASLPFADFATAGGGHEFQIQTPSSNPLAGGRLYYSEGDLNGNQPGPGAPYRYDYVEFTLEDSAHNPGTLDVNGDVTGIDQVGIPSRMSFEDANGNILNNSGTSLPATRSMGCWTDIYNAVATSPWGITPAFLGDFQQVTPAGTRVRLNGPTWMPKGIAEYPSMLGYLQSLAGKSIAVTGYFGGNTKLKIPSTNYAYTGTFDQWGNLALAGTLGGTGYPAVGETIYLPARGFYDSMAPNQNWVGAANNTWVTSTGGYGTGYNVYAQNGPYQLGGTAPSTYEVGVDGTHSWALNSAYGGDPSRFFQSIGNDVYGWIYGDLVASMANGFLGPLGYSTSVWNTNNDKAGQPFASPQHAFGAAFTSKGLAIPTQAAWDPWQQAVSTTSDSYGVSLGDRFVFLGAKSSSPDMSTSQAPGSGGKPTGIIHVTLLPNDGCSSVAALAPTPQSLVLSTGQAITVLPAAQQPPSGVNNDFVTLTGQGFTPTSFTIAPVLPRGLSFNANTGVVSGAPVSTMARTAFTITGTDGSNTARATLNITVGTRAITPATQLLVGSENQSLPSSAPFTATGFSSTPTYSISPALPAGLSFNSSTGVVSGSPQQGQPATGYTVTARGASGSAMASITISIGSPRSIAPASQQLNGTVGSPIASTVAYSATGFATSPSYSVSPSLPPGLTINPTNGVISGTPAAAQSAQAYSITAQGQGGSATASVTITVAGVAGSITPSSQQTGGAVGRYLATQVLTANGLGSGVSYALNGSIPAGLTLNPTTGVISGTPTGSPETSFMTITGTGSLGSALTGILLTVCPSGEVWGSSSRTCLSAA